MNDFIIVIVILAAIFLYSKFGAQQELTRDLVTTEYCDMDNCKNTCQNINAIQRKPDGEFPYGLDSDGNIVEDMQFPAENCDPGTKLIRRNNKCTGGDHSLSEEQRGEVECTSDDCCIPKTCGSDILLYSLEDKKNYLLAINNITLEQSGAITTDGHLTREQNITLEQKIRRDNYCPYQQALRDRNQTCLGGDNGIGGDCSNEADGECCEEKTCSTHWNNNNDGTEWGSTSRNGECPHQPDTDGGTTVTNILFKRDDDTLCDTCDHNDCCYTQSDFCKVQVPGESIPPENVLGVNTNVNRVNFPSSVDGITFPPGGNTSVDLTSNFFLTKDNIADENIQNLLSYGTVDGVDQSNIGIKCDDNYKYGMCSDNIDIKQDGGTCKEHDNNQRECLLNEGCSFILGDRPRVDYTQCSDTIPVAGQSNNIIKVGDCINTCTALGPGDYEINSGVRTQSDTGLTDGDYNYFTQTPISGGEHDGSYMINQDYYSNKLNTDEDYPYGSHNLDCLDHRGDGGHESYFYSCEGGGSYFSVSNLQSCKNTCEQLHNGGERCFSGDVYDATQAAVYSSYAEFQESCCTQMTCDTLSAGDYGATCLNHQKRHESSATETMPATRENCCVNKTCSDFTDDYNELLGELGEDGSFTDENICLPGRIFQGDRDIPSTYLHGVSNSDNTSKKNRMDEYRSGIADYDIGCCSSLTCRDWLENNRDSLGITDSSQKFSEASEQCGDGKFFIGDILLSSENIPDIIDENNPCCVGDSEITCSPTLDLQNMGNFNVNGYTAPDDINVQQVFDVKRFSIDSDTSESDEVQYIMDADATIQCDMSNDFQQDGGGIKYKCVPKVDDTSTGIYYLSGCNNPNDHDTNRELLCSLPSQLENNIQVNGFSFDAENNVVNYSHFTGNLDQFSCNESTETPHFHRCGGNGEELIIDGCHYQNLPQAGTAGDGSALFYTDRFYSLGEHITGTDRESSGHNCDMLYDITRTWEEDDIDAEDSDLRAIIDDIKDRDPNLNDAQAIAKMKGNVRYFSCRCYSPRDAEMYDGNVCTSYTDEPSCLEGQCSWDGSTCSDPIINNECHDYERQVRFKYIFDNDEDYYLGDNQFKTNKEVLCGTEARSTIEDWCIARGIESSMTRNIEGGGGVDGGDTVSQYPINSVLNDDNGYVCEPGYYPHRGEKYDYCKPCSSIYKNKHPITAVAEEFCGGKLDVDPSGNITGFLNHSGVSDNQYDNKYIDGSGSIQNLGGTHTEQITSDSGVVSLDQFTELMSRVGGGVSSWDGEILDSAALFTRLVADTGDGDGLMSYSEFDYLMGSVFGLNIGSASDNFDPIQNYNYGPYLDLTDQPSVDSAGSGTVSDTPVQNYPTDSSQMINENNFTLGTRRCADSGSEHCATEVKLYDFSAASAASAASDTYFNKALDWWKLFFDEHFNKAAGTDLDPDDVIYSASETPLSEGVAPTTKKTLMAKRNPGEGSYNLQISDITELNRDHYTYRNQLQITDSDGSNPHEIESVCNNVPGSAADYIPSFEGNEYIGECKRCVNKMPESADGVPTDADGVPTDVERSQSVTGLGRLLGAETLDINGYYRSGKHIIRNIRENDPNKPIPVCSRSADMFDTYNEGNIIGFRKPNSSLGTTSSNFNPCKDGFIYKQRGFHNTYRAGTNPTPHQYFDTHHDYIAKYFKCMPREPKLVAFCENQTDEDECNNSIVAKKKDMYPLYDNFSHHKNKLFPQGNNIMYDHIDDDEKIKNNRPRSYCGWNDEGGGKCETIYKLNGGPAMHPQDYILHEFYNKSGQDIMHGTANNRDFLYSELDSPYDENNENAKEYNSYNNGIKNRVDLSEYQLKYHNQSALEYLSPHITNFTSKDAYDYSNFIKIPDDAPSQPAEAPTDDIISELNNLTTTKTSGEIINNIKEGTGEVTDLSLRTLSAINSLNEGHDIYSYNKNLPNLRNNINANLFGQVSLSNDRIYPPYNISSKITGQDKSDGSSTMVSFLPTRINPYKTVLNTEMKNRCHPILWDGPVDFFYKKDGNWTISSSCYLRNNSDRLAITSNDVSSGSITTEEHTYLTSANPIIPHGSQSSNADNFVSNNDSDYSIKSTPLYYGKGRLLNGGTITQNSSVISDDDKYNILNPSIASDGKFGIKYAKLYDEVDVVLSPDVNKLIKPKNDADPSRYEWYTDTGFADAALFPLMDRVRGCHNDSLLYTEGEDIPGTGTDYDPVSDKSALGITLSNQNQEIWTRPIRTNEKEQCIFHYNLTPRTSGVSAILETATRRREIYKNQAQCVNACLNNDECDLVRITTYTPDVDSVRCELIKWNRIPELEQNNINLEETIIHGHMPDSGDYTELTINNSDDVMNKLRQRHLGGHLINGKTDKYDQSNLKGVQEWFERVHSSYDTGRAGGPPGGTPEVYEMDHEWRPSPIYDENDQEIGRSGIFRTDYYDWERAQPDGEDSVRKWRYDYDASNDYNTNIYKNATDTQNVNGRKLWVNGTELYEDGSREEIWITMNKIRTPKEAGSIPDIFNSINNSELLRKYGLSEIPVLSGNWRQTYVLGDNNINEENTYVSNDSTMTHESETSFSGGPGVRERARENPDNDDYQSEIEVDNRKIYRNVNDGAATEEAAGGGYYECPPGTYFENNLWSWQGEGPTSLHTQDEIDDPNKNSGTKFRGKGCVQVLNECASCGDIYDYHLNKGDFDDGNDPMANEILKSYGCSDGNDTNYLWHYIHNDVLATSQPGRVGGGGAMDQYPGTAWDDTLDSDGLPKNAWFGEDWHTSNRWYQADTDGWDAKTKILDTLGAKYKMGLGGSIYQSQHGLMAKTPDGNIIDAEKCICPENMRVKVRRQGNSPQALIAKCV